MGNKRLNRLARLCIQHDIPIDAHDAIEEFSHCHPRRLRLSTIFCRMNLWL